MTERNWGYAIIDQAKTYESKKAQPFVLCLAKRCESVGLESHKFMRQKADYVHLNPVRAGLCDHPGKWKWSSYGGYLRHLPKDLPMEIDKQPFWTDEELKAVGR